MDFTREPIIETVITPKEGCKLVVRSSKAIGPEEHFVDAVEVVSFGHALFFRSLEKPKPFLVPVSDYEVLEVREARIVLKNVGIDRSIKIGGGKDASRLIKESSYEKKEDLTSSQGSIEVEENPEPSQQQPEPRGIVDSRLDKKRDRRRHYRRRRKDERDEKDEELKDSNWSPENREDQNREDVGEAKTFSSQKKEEEGQSIEQAVLPAPSLSSILPPPTTLIRETIARYKNNDLYKGAFYLREEDNQGSITAGADEEEDELFEPIEDDFSFQESSSEDSSLSSEEDPFWKDEESQSAEEEADDFIKETASSNQPFMHSQKGSSYSDPVLSLDSEEEEKPSMAKEENRDSPPQ